MENQEADQKFGGRPRVSRLGRGVGMLVQKVNRCRGDCAGAATAGRRDE